MEYSKWHYAVSIINQPIPLLDCSFMIALLANSDSNFSWRRINALSNSVRSLMRALAKNVVVWTDYRSSWERRAFFFIAVVLPRPTREEKPMCSAKGISSFSTRMYVNKSLTQPKWSAEEPSAILIWTFATNTILPPFGPHPIVYYEFVTYEL